ncbi:MAG: carboxypeptidase-like regulatory domain-containing protein, partial [Candidatus Micrarchaeia archaeon]
MYHRGQGSFEYLLLLGGTVLVATVVTVMAQGSVAGANNVFNESTNDYSSYIQGGVNDVLTNNTLVHEQPSGCMYGNPACDAGYFCDNGVCKKMNAALIGYVFDTSGAPLSGAIIHLPSGIGPDATTDAAGYYAVSASANQSTGMYSVVASKSPANVQSSATVNLTVGYASMQNFSLGYNPAVLSGYIRDYASAGISGAAVTCAGYSATTA